MALKRYFLLGLFFVVAFGILAYYTLFMSDTKLFGEVPTLTIQSEDAGGLREGDGVLVAGMRWGSIKSLTFDPLAPRAERITIVAALDQPIDLKSDYAISVEAATVLGGHNLVIEPGLADTAHPEGSPRFASVKGNVLESAGGAIDAVGALFSENREDVRTIVTNLAKASEQVVSGQGVLSRILDDAEMAANLESVVSNAKLTMENLSSLSVALNEGEGTLGLLIRDKEMYTKLEKIADDISVLLENATAASKDLVSGEGALGRALTDKKMGQDLAFAIEDIRRLVHDANAGDGLLPRLLKDKQLADDAAAALADIRRVTGLLADGEGTLGALLVKPEVYDQVSRLLADLETFGKDLAQGDGTLPRLVRDDDIYLELQRAVGTVARTLEEFREAAPISTFTSVLFAAF